MTFIQAASGTNFDLANPNAATIHLEDIAHALSHCCRFAGHTRVFYSVAQHSVLVSNLVAKEHRLDALMHDAAEAYLGDMTTPLKQFMPQFKVVEARVEAAIRFRFGLARELVPEIKAADLIMLATERREFLRDQDTPWPILDGIVALSTGIAPLEPQAAKQLFLDRFLMLVRASRSYDRRTLGQGRGPSSTLRNR